MDIVPVTDGECLRLLSSGGHLDTYQKTKFGGFHVCFNPASLAKILSLALVTEEYRVTMDSELENALVVHKFHQALAWIVLLRCKLSKLI